MYGNLTYRYDFNVKLHYITIETYSYESVFH